MKEIVVDNFAGGGGASTGTCKGEFAGIVQKRKCVMKMTREQHAADLKRKWKKFLKTQKERKKENDRGMHGN